MPVLPIVAHAPETAAGDTQLASPSASEASIFPNQGEPHVILICPFTSSLADGEVVQSHILTPSS